MLKSIENTFGNNILNDVSFKNTDGYIINTQEKYIITILYTRDFKKYKQETGHRVFYIFYDTINYYYKCKKKVEIYS